MNTPANEWREAIIDLGVEVDTHQDGDAFIRTFTFNEAQLQAFLTTHSAHLVERIEAEKIRASGKHDPWSIEVAHIENHQSYNQALDQAIDIVGKTNGM